MLGQDLLILDHLEHSDSSLNICDGLLLLNTLCNSIKFTLIVEGLELLHKEAIGVELELSENVLSQRRDFRGKVSYDRVKDRVVVEGVLDDLLLTIFVVLGLEYLAESVPPSAEALRGE